MAYIFHVYITLWGNLCSWIKTKSQKPPKKRKKEKILTVTLNCSGQWEDTKQNTWKVGQRAIQKLLILKWEITLHVFRLPVWVFILSFFQWFNSYIQFFFCSVYVLCTETLILTEGHVVSSILPISGGFWHIGCKISLSQLSLLKFNSFKWCRERKEVVVWFVGCFRQRASGEHDKWGCTDPFLTDDWCAWSLTNSEGELLFHVFGRLVPVFVWSRC